MLFMLLIFVRLIAIARASGRNNRVEQSEFGHDYKGPWIVHLHRSISHDRFEETLRQSEARQQPYLQYRATFTNKFRRLLHASVVEGISKSDLLKLDGVKRVVPDTTKRILRSSADDHFLAESTFTIPWGIDRLDQGSLPLDGLYSPSYTGAGTDIYIVDTGIDATHQEFQAGPHYPVREVKNVYDVYGKTKYLKTHPPANNDGEGHATHVAGTAGGRTVGVAPGANIYGLKVLDDQGSGSTSGIIEALEYVADAVHLSKRPSVVSMSLGGPCETELCSEDSLVMAVENLYSLGIAVSVAAGNEGCNACKGSPNSAPHAVVSGATDEYDKITYFSNYGQCVDIFSPGMDIISSCATVLCGENSNLYVSFSGTSMACPHTTGVIAQLFEKNLRVSDLEEALSCASSINQLVFDPMDTISRNLLLQTPTLESVAECDLGFGCDSDCSSHGVCLPVHKDSSDIKCHCMDSYYGESCSEEIPSTCDQSEANINVRMFDAYGDGWTFTSFAITDSVTGDVVGNAMDSLCYGNQAHRSYCLEIGQCYSFEVSRGYFPSEVAWNMCGASGGAPYRGNFCVTDASDDIVDDSYGSSYSGNGYGGDYGGGGGGGFYYSSSAENGLSLRHRESQSRLKGFGCSFLCAEGSQMISVDLKDSYGDGWGGGYYSIRSEDGDALFGGTLLDGTSESHEVCLENNKCYYVMVDYLGETSDEISYDICGTTLLAMDIAQICIHGPSEGCTVELKNRPPLDFSCTESPVSLTMLDMSAQGWLHSSYTITQQQDPYSIAASGGLTNFGFIKSDYLCLSDGCYDFAVATDGHLSNFKDQLWNVGGVRGPVPWTAEICVEKAYRMVYGLEHCPYVKSYAQKSDLNLFVLSHVHEEYNIPVLDIAFNVHSINSLCGLQDGCYHLDIGGGKYSGADRSSATLCGITTPFPVSATLCLENNATTCSLTDVAVASCNTGLYPVKLLKIDNYGDGWGVSYKIKAGTTIYYSGTLSDGMYEAEDLCLKPQCYTFTIANGQHEDEILWGLCGFIGSAPISASFCVTESGCYFNHATDDSYNNDEDDDFTPAIKAKPTISPSQPPIFLPTHVPVPNPTKSPFPQRTESPTALPTETGTVIAFSYSANITLRLSVSTSPLKDSDVSFVGFAFKHILESSSFNIWRVSTTAVGQKSVHLAVNRRRLLKVFDVHNERSGNSIFADYKVNLKDSIVDVLCALIFVSPTEVSPDEIQQILSSANKDGSLDAVISEALVYEPDTAVTDALRVVSVAVAGLVELITVGDAQPISDDIYDQIWPNNDISSQSNLPMGLIVIILVVFSILVSICVLLYSILSSWRTKNLNLSQNLSSTSTETPSTLSSMARKTFFRSGSKYKHVMDSSAHNPMVNDEGITSFDESSRGNFEIELGNLSPNIYGIVEDDNEGGQVTVEFNPHFSGLPMSFVEVKQAD